MRKSTMLMMSVVVFVTFTFSLSDLCIYYWDCCDHWIGGSDLDVEGTFVWSSDNSTLGFVNWYPGEPRDFHNEDCMTLCREEHWNDNNCDSFYPYICKTPAM